MKKAKSVSMKGANVRAAVGNDKTNAMNKKKPAKKLSTKVSMGYDTKSIKTGKNLLKGKM